MKENINKLRTRGFCKNIIGISNNAMYLARKFDLSTKGIVHYNPRKDGDARYVDLLAKAISYSADRSHSRISEKLMGIANDETGRILEILMQMQD